METVDMGLGRPDASAGESGRGEVVVGESREPLIEHPGRLAPIAAAGVTQGHAIAHAVEQAGVKEVAVHVNPAETKR